MALESQIAETIAQLQGGDVSARRAAVRQAAGLLRRADCAAPCRGQLIAALRAAAEGDPASTVRELARDALAALPVAALAPSLLPDDRQHMLGVRCPNGHVTYFDKRRICTEETIFVRNPARDEAGRELDELALPCSQCDAVIKVWVDCRGYR